jgi:hypothetical protein
MQNGLHVLTDTVVNKEFKTTIQYLFPRSIIDGLFRTDLMIITVPAARVLPHWRMY